MLQRLGHLACVIAFFAICGGHWAVLQTVAWAQMLRDYSQESGLAAAIQQTFSGERPCSMCVNIAQGQQKESQSPAFVSLAKKLEGVPAAVPVRIPRPIGREFRYWDGGDRHYTSWVAAPPVPVPIA